MATTIRRATIDDHKIIVQIGSIAVEESHRASCSVEDMNHFLSAHYNDDAIRTELSNPDNIYHIIYHNDQPAGFSKIILNAAHPNIPQTNATKLDRIYLLKEFFDLKLGRELMQFNVELSKANGQAGMWLFTWVDNHRAVSFYKKAGFVVIGAHKFKVSETHYNSHHQMFLGYSEGT
jgi:ribosomal protein S18 acetylase RimI-like enzyme